MTPKINRVAGIYAMSDQESQKFQYNLGKVVPTSNKLGQGQQQQNNLQPQNKPLGIMGVWMKLVAGGSHYDDGNNGSGGSRGSGGSNGGGGGGNGDEDFDPDEYRHEPEMGDFLTLAYIQQHTRMDLLKKQ